MTAPTPNAPTATLSAGEAIAKRIAVRAVQSLADSLPDEDTIEAQDRLKGTPQESMFVVSAETLEELIAVAISNAMYDGELAARQSPPMQDFHGYFAGINAAPGMSTPAAEREGERERAIAARLEAATPGPWYVAMHGSDGLKRDVFQREPEKRWDHPLTTYLSSANAEFIANAPEDIKHLLAALLAARRENETLEQDAKRYRALRASFPVVEIQWTHDRFVLTTQEADGGFCTYQAATLQEFDEAMQEFEERAEYRAALAATPEGTTHTGENP